MLIWVLEKDGFFKAHQDTPCGDSMFGSLVVVFPAPHEGGQLSLRLADQHWIADFAEQFAAASEPSICFIAFFGDVEHQVLPVTSGHRVTLTYNLHFRAQKNILRALSSPFHDKLKARLIELVNDTETLPKGVTSDSDCATNISTTRPSRLTRYSTRSKGSMPSSPTYAKSSGCPAPSGCCMHKKKILPGQTFTCFLV